MRKTKPKPEPITARWVPADADQTKEAINKFAHLFAVVNAQSDARNLAIIRLILADKKLEAIELLLKNQEPPRSSGVWTAVPTPAK